MAIQTLDLVSKLIKYKPMGRNFPGNGKADICQNTTLMRIRVILASTKLNKTGYKMCREYSYKL